MIIRLWGALLVFVAACGANAQLPAGFTDTPFVGGFFLPTGMAFLPDGRILVTEKRGPILLIKNGVLQSTPFGTIPCDYTAGRGVLGIAIDPLFATNRFIYLYYTAGANSIEPPATPKGRVSRFQVEGDSLVLESEFILVDGFPSDSGSDNGGGLRFGSDGNLFITTGDGGTTHTNSQDLSNLGGKLLRIRTDGQIPNDNPFVGVPNVRGEIWAYGLRNTFRFSFRPNTNIPFLADNGDHTWEEVNVGASGGNYGWPLYEGPTTEPGFITPLHAYNHEGQGRSIIAAHFGKSSRWPSVYANRFLYADYKLNQLFYLDIGPSNQLLGTGLMGPVATGPVDFAFGPDGALYYVSISTQSIRKISYRATVASVSAPDDIDGGTNVTGTVTLNVVAPAGRQSVALSTDNPGLVTVPASVTVGPDALSQAFTISTKGVLAPTPVTIRASLGITVTKSVTLQPNGVKAVYALSPTVVSGASPKFTVMLQSVPVGPAVVALQSSSPALTIPSTLTLDAGMKSKGFYAQAASVGVNTPATVTATWCGISKSKSVTIVPALLSDLIITPNPILGGTSGTGQVVLNGTAKPGGSVVTTYDNTSLITTPASVTVPVGSTSQTFAFSTLYVTATTTRTMSAKLGSVTKTVTVTLLH